MNYASFIIVMGEPKTTAQCVFAGLLLDESQCDMSGCVFLIEIGSSLIIRRITDTTTLGII
jgi:hypothetical protein